LPKGVAQAHSCRVKTQAKGKRNKNQSLPLGNRLIFLFSCLCFCLCKSKGRHRAKGNNKIREQRPEEYKSERGCERSAEEINC
jgi:hypothetical protein